MNDETHELTVQGVGSGERRALLDAMQELDHDHPVRIDATVSELTEERLEELLDALLGVEQKMASLGSYSDADGASQMHDQLQRLAREEGLL